jgi:hypothetical protein
VCFVALAACGTHTEDARPAWPAGTVLALGERAIGAPEVDEAAGIIAQLQPRDSIDQLRRVALTNIVLPRCAAQAIDPEGRVLAQKRADAAQRELVAGAQLMDPLPVERKGAMLQQGLELWNALMQLAPGEWTAVVESPGCFQVARLKEKGTAPLPGQVQLTAEVYDFPYIPGEDSHDRIQAQLERSQLVYVDESWRALVPIGWQYKLRGGSR